MGLTCKSFWQGAGVCNMGSGPLRKGFRGAASNLEGKMRRLIFSSLIHQDRKCILDTTVEELSTVEVSQLVSYTFSFALHKKGFSSVSKNIRMSNGCFCATACKKYVVMK